MKSNLLVVLIFVKYATSDGGSGTLDNSHENLDMIEKLALRSIGYLKTPEDWHQAFVVLAKKYKEDIERYKNESHTNEARYKEDIERCKNKSCVNEAQYKEDIERYKNETLINKRENVKCLSVLKFRTLLLEDAEWYFHLEHVFPNEDKMFADLQSNASAYTVTISRNWLMNMKNLGNFEHINEHTIKWLHFLAFSKGKLATRLRKKLMERNIDAFEFCFWAGRFFSNAGGALYFLNSSVEELDPEIVQEALGYFGMASSSVLEVVKILLGIGSMTTLYHDN